MNFRKSQRHDKGALEILEEATHLVRLAPTGTLLCYYSGALPFVMGLLFFWTDMSSSVSASSHLLRGSLGLTILFIWMKCWQAAFACRLQAVLIDGLPSPWSVRRVLRLAGVQLATMPWAFIAFPLALLAVFPIGCCYAFFHNLSVTGNGEDDLRKSFRRAWSQSALWPAQNFKLLFIIILFSLFVFMNLGVAVSLVPRLLRTFLGVETVFSRSNLFLFNTTFWMSIGGLTYLCVNPLAKASYVLRCYYGESLSSGQDLLSELRRLRSQACRAVVLITLGFSLSIAAPGISNAAKEPSSLHKSPDSGRLSVSVHQLDTAITKVMENIEYSWRLPREGPRKPKESNRGFLTQILETLGSWLAYLWKGLRDVIAWIGDWLKKLFPHKEVQTASHGDVLGSVKVWFSILLVVVACAVALLARQLLNRRKRAVTETGEQELAVEVKPDLADENTSADELPAARWLATAKKLLAQGDLRLAVRAFYFAGLAHLAGRNLLTIASFKSNRDYERELGRRAHALPDLIKAFSENVTILEMIWYGMHSVRRDMLDRFLSNQKRIITNDQEW